MTQSGLNTEIAGYRNGESSLGQRFPIYETASLPIKNEVTYQTVAEETQTIYAHFEQSIMTQSDTKYMKTYI